MKLGILMATAGMLILAAGCGNLAIGDRAGNGLRGDYNRTNSPYKPGDPVILEEGRQLYEIKCRICHGERGDGKGIGAGDLDYRPADLTQPRFRLLPEGNVFRMVSEGVPEHEMPAWKHHLTPEDIWRVVTYIRSFPQPEPKAGNRP